MQTQAGNHSPGMVQGSPERLDISGNCSMVVAVWLSDSQTFELSERESDRLYAYLSQETNSNFKYPSSPKFRTPKN